MDRVEEFILSGSRTGSYSQCVPELSSFGFLDIHLGDGESPVEIPDFIIRSVNTFVQSDYGLISYVLCEGTSTTTRRLVRGALSDFMRANRFGNGIPHVIMSSGRDYYGLPGVIFDGNFNLLMMMTSTVNFIRNDRTSGVQTNILEHTCRISPLVFMHQDSIIEKTIIKKVIPFCASHVTIASDFVCNTSRVISDDALGKNIRVIIEDLNPMFIRRIVSPNVDTNISDSMHDLLCHNIKEIISDN